MHVVIAGGTGFLGRALSTHLEARGDHVQVLTRRATASHHVAWVPGQATGAWVSTVAAADVVVNLSGKPVDAGRWNQTRKAVLIESRVSSTRALVDALGDVGRPVALLNASAVGFYGSRAEEPVDESAASGSDFLASLCVAWEAEAMRASTRHRVVLLRTGLVLDAHAGALSRLLLPFRLGVGGPMGSGRQYWPWIHRDDWVRLVVAAIDDSRVVGPLNLSAPHPCTNREFARTLGRVMRRPAIMPAPAFALRLALGEMADSMVLGGQCAIPARALALGFQFRFESLESALRDLLGS